MCNLLRIKCKIRVSKSLQCTFIINSSIFAHLISMDRPLQIPSRMKEKDRGYRSTGTIFNVPQFVNIKRSNAFYVQIPRPKMID